jgi:signal transduction histidine kinase
MTAIIITLATPAAVVLYLCRGASTGVAAWPWIFLLLILLLALALVSVVYLASKTTARLRHVEDHLRSSEQRRKQQRLFLGNLLKRSRHDLQRSEARCAPAAQRDAERTEIAEKRTKQLQALTIELLETEERESQRIAHLLNEDLQQTLVAARFELHNYSQSLPRQPQLEHIGQLLDELLQKSSRLSQDLSPTWLNHVDLLSSLKWLARQMERKFGMQIKVEAGSAMKLENTALKHFIYRAVQELLDNVRQHSGVLSAHITITCSEADLFITVRDKGKGFNPRVIELTSEDKGFGLLRLRERAKHIGGNLEAESTADCGSAFTLTVPMEWATSSVEGVRFTV